ncbi:hypothetical protein D3C85_579740 [compost metagenome]
MVMMWPPLLRLRWSMRAASEVDLPEPVPPTKSTRPRFSMMVSSSTGGSFKSSKRGISVLMLRATRETSLRCLKMLTRKRPIWGREMARFISSSFSNCCFCSESMRSAAILATSPGSSGTSFKGRRAPLNLAQGGAPVER